MQDEYGQIVKSRILFLQALDYPGVGPLHAICMKVKEQTL